MKTILVLTDFSTRAGYAAEFAMHIAIKSKANLILCHVIEITFHNADDAEFSWPAPDHLMLKNKSILELKELAKRLEKLIPQDNEGTVFKPFINCITNFGLLTEVTKNVIHEKSVNLVVTGSHKSNGLARYLLGRHTYAVLDKINCPVLLVPKNLKFKGINIIAYATDLNFNNQKVIQYLVDMAKPFKATIAVNHISPIEFPGTMSEQAMRCSLNEQLGPDHPLVAYHTIKGDNVKENILEMTGEGGVDILALVHKRVGFFERLFHASISKQMADDAVVPLLVLPYSFSMDVADFTNDQLDHFCYETGNSR